MQTVVDRRFNYVFLVSQMEEVCCGLEWIGAHTIINLPMHLDFNTSYSFVKLIYRPIFIQRQVPLPVALRVHPLTGARALNEQIGGGGGGNLNFDSTSDHVCPESELNLPVMQMANSRL